MPHHPESDSTSPTGCCRPATIVQRRADRLDTAWSHGKRVYVASPHNCRASCVTQRSINNCSHTHAFILFSTNIIPRACTARSRNVAPRCVPSLWLCSASVIAIALAAIFPLAEDNLQAHVDSATLPIASVNTASGVAVTIAYLRVYCCAARVSLGGTDTWSGSLKPRAVHPLSARISAVVN